MPWQWVTALAALIVALAVSVWSDLRHRLIYNAVTLPALVVCFVVLGWYGSWPLLVQCSIGCVICVLPFLIAWRFGAMGAGDVKLIAVCGFVAGGWDSFLFGVTELLYVSIAGGVQAVVWLAVARARGQEKPRYVPYGVAIAAGTLIAFLWGDRVL